LFQATELAHGHSILDGSLQHKELVVAYALVQTVVDFYDTPAYRNMLLLEFFLEGIHCPNRLSHPGGALIDKPCEVDCLFGEHLFEGLELVAGDEY